MEELIRSGNDTVGILCGRNGSVQGLFKEWRCGGERDVDELDAVWTWLTSLPKAKRSLCLFCRQAWVAAVSTKSPDGGHFHWLDETLSQEQRNKAYEAR